MHHRSITGFREFQVRAGRNDGKGRKLVHRLDELEHRLGVVRRLDGLEHNVRHHVVGPTADAVGSGHSPEPKLRKR